jgi:trimethyllysine dioxygenase
VLHGRSSFVGERRLCGAYIAGDDYRSRLTGLSKQFGEKDGHRENQLAQFGIQQRRDEADSKYASAWSDYI